jgi:hypothetical protein
MDKLTTTAHHEAAHAVVNYRAVGFVPGNTTIAPQADTLGGSADVVSDSTNPEHMEARVLSCYAGGHADRINGCFNVEECEIDEEAAAEVLRMWGWENREAELRERSLTLTREHWSEIVAVAEELLKYTTLDDAEVEAIADGDLDGLARYRKILARK